jgi:alkylresorcinol/alkylpyrone synthase
MAATIAGLATEVPPHPLPQERARELARDLFRGIEGIERLLKVFERSGVRCRHLAMPPQWYLEPHSFPEKNGVWAHVALELSVRASRRAMELAGVAPGEIGAVIFASTTGLATPSLDSHLIKELDLPRDIARLPLWGLGCAGGVAGLARAADLLSVTGNPVLVVAAELCSVTLIAEDLSKTNLIGSSLFADGAVAAVLSDDGDGPELLGSFSRLFDQSEALVAWDLVPQGLKVRLARTTPDILQGRLQEVLEDGLTGLGLELRNIRHYSLHPGGAKVLDAYQESLHLSPEDLTASRGVLRDHGNMSSPTALFALERIIETSPRTESAGLLLAPGPGLSIEGIVFKW